MRTNVKKYSRASCKAALYERANLTEEDINNLKESMHRRIQACINAGSGNTDY